MARSVRCRASTLAIGRNEIVGLIGDNGAGKSTLIKALLPALSALPRASSTSRDELVDWSSYSVREAHRLRFETVYQEKSLGEKNSRSGATSSSAARSPNPPSAFIKVAEERRIANDHPQAPSSAFARCLGIDARFHHLQTLGRRTPGHRHRPRAMHFDSDLIILSMSRTVALAISEVRKVLDFVRSIKNLRPGLHLYRAQPRPCA